MSFKMFQARHLAYVLECGCVPNFSPSAEQSIVLLHIVGCGALTFGRTRHLDNPGSRHAGVVCMAKTEETQSHAHSPSLFDLCLARHFVAIGCAFIGRKPPKAGLLGGSGYLVMMSHYRLRMN